MYFENVSMRAWVWLTLNECDIYSYFPSHKSYIYCSELEIIYPGHTP